MNQEKTNGRWILFIILSVAMVSGIAAVFSAPPAVQAQSAETTGTATVWFVHAEDSQWQPGEMAMVQNALANATRALDDAGFDSRAIFAGYHFRRYGGEYVEGVEGQIALVRHNSQEIILGDAAFARLWGYYIYHELGHVVDKRSSWALSDAFQAQTGGTMSAGTADGYWLNDHARADYKEGTADAFALWVITRYTENPKPVFAGMPNDTDYEGIVNTFAVALDAAR